MENNIDTKTEKALSDIEESGSAILLNHWRYYAR